MITETQFEFSGSFLPGLKPESGALGVGVVVSHGTQFPFQKFP
jgi:hypothetical protein